MIGTQDRFALKPVATSKDFTALLGKTVIVAGTLPQAAKGRVPDILRYNTISEAQ
ncbi:hypothetical protein [Terriglobus saanensis]|uniref:Uncharacterized protein n=1 Tax=Terriglobus saanensis (strain ATCC BAA-1853 / DSM 23119 / SP1PR4) TaxID=401053 RepID=E8V388_TERSS|nr:hypothetical protein [Terriglobus saanensis]ADV82445.1 hypothetical protein AciPR4_1632 [Terriglobus saanensis SP1PR4]